jgi:hypothetical protein
VEAVVRTGTTAAGAAEHDFAEGTEVLWNDIPFETILPVRRKSSVVRTRKVTAARRREYARIGWPTEYILRKEHRLKLVGEEMTMVAFSNAPEAEFELPDRIVTPVRDLGSFRDARLTWRGHEELAFVSVRLTSLRQRLKAAEATRSGAAAPAPTMAARAAQSGLILSGTGLPDRMKPAELELANYLIARKDTESGEVFSLAEIATAMGVSDETVRRRKLELEDKYPELRRVLAAYRSRNGKGEAIVPARADVAPPDEDDAG